MSNNIDDVKKKLKFDQSKIFKRELKSVLKYIIIFIVLILIFYRLTVIKCNFSKGLDTKKYRREC